MSVPETLSGYTVYYTDFIPLLIRRLKGKLLWLSDVQWYCRLWRGHAAKWTIFIWFCSLSEIKEPFSLENLGATYELLVDLIYISI